MADTVEDLKKNAGIFDRMFAGDDYYQDKLATRRKLQQTAEQDAASAALNNQKATELGMQNQFSQEALAPIMAELQALKSKDIYSRTTQVVDASLKDGKYEDAWNGFLSDPSVKELYKGMNVQSVQTFNPANEAHVRAYRQSGMPEEVLNYLVKGPDTNIVPTNENGKVVLNEQKVTPEDLKAIAMAYPLVQGLDNSIRVQPLGDFMASTGLLKGVLSATDKQRYLDVVDQGINTLGKVAQGSYSSKLAKEKAESTKLLAEAGETTQKAEGLKYDNQIKDKILSGDGTAESKAMEILKLTDPKTYAMLQKSNVELRTAEVGLQTAQQNLVKTGVEIEGKKLDVKTKQMEQQDIVASKVSKVAGLDDGIQQVDNLLSRVGILSSTPAIGTVINKAAELAGNTPTADFYADLQTLSAKGFLASVPQMKGMGALSDAEGKMLSSAISSLEKGQTPANLTKNMQYLKRVLVREKELESKKLGTQPNEPKDTPKQAKGPDGRMYTIGQTITALNGAKFTMQADGAMKKVR